ncbi:MAG: hypothetical protein U9N49_11005 [Campylobacterota bacterium]|nr:hypothetical protein [Campylobacterota bacterium]
MKKLLFNILLLAIFFSGFAKAVTATTICESGEITNQVSQAGPIYYATFLGTDKEATDLAKQYNDSNSIQDFVKNIGEIPVETWGWYSGTYAPVTAGVYIDGIMGYTVRWQSSYTKVFCSCGTETTTAVDQDKYDFVKKDDGIGIISGSYKNNMEQEAYYIYLDSLQECTAKGGFAFNVKEDLCGHTFNCLKPKCGDILPTSKDECSFIERDGVPADGFCEYIDYESPSTLPDQCNLSSGTFGEPDYVCLIEEHGTNVCGECYYNAPIPNCLKDSNTTEDQNQTDSNTTDPTPTPIPTDNNTTDSNDTNSTSFEDCHQSCVFDPDNSHLYDQCIQACKDEYNITDDNTTTPTPTPTDNGTEEGNTSETNTTTSTPTPTDSGTGDLNTTDGNTTGTDDGNITWGSSDGDFNDLISSANKKIGDEFNSTYNKWIDKFISGFTVTIPEPLSDGCTCQDVEQDFTLPNSIYAQHTHTYHHSFFVCEHLTEFLDKYVPLLKFIVYILIARHAVRRLI